MVNILELFSPQPLTVNILEPFYHEKSVKVNILNSSHKKNVNLSINILEYF